MFRRPDETVGQFWQRKVLLTIRVMGMCTYLGVAGFAFYLMGKPVSETPWYFWPFVVGMVLSGLATPSEVALKVLGGERNYGLINAVVGVLLVIAGGGLVLAGPFSLWNVWLLVTGVMTWIRGMRVLAGLRGRDVVRV